MSGKIIKEIELDADQHGKLQKTLTVSERMLRDLSKLVASLYEEAYERQEEAWSAIYRLAGYEDIRATRQAKVRIEVCHISRRIIVREQEEKSVVG